jgi:hypothetical protein
MRRFSIRALMAVIVVSAVGLAALRNANDWWAGIMLLLALVAFGTALLGAIFLQGRNRAWWTGFALFCGGYLALTLVPVVSTEIAPKLLTTQLLDYVHSQTKASASNAFRTSLTEYQKTRRQLLNSEQRTQDPNGPLLVAARAKLTNEYQELQENSLVFEVHGGVCSYCCGKCKRVCACRTIPLRVARRTAGRNGRLMVLHKAAKG